MADRFPLEPERASNTTLHIRVLGTVEVEFAGGLQSLGGPRSYRMLAALLVSLPGAVSLERLRDVLWEVAPQSARQQIHNTVSSLRSRLTSLPGVTLVKTGSGYRLDLDKSTFDLARFERDVRLAKEAETSGDIDAATDLLTGALDLWRGPAFAGLEGAFFENAAARLNEDRLNATESLLALRIRRGGGGAVSGTLKQMVSENPYREAFRVLLMKALYQSGRQIEALAVYDEGRRLLADEFGLDPGPELAALHSTILNSHPLDVSSDAHSPHLTPSASLAHADTVDETIANGPCYLPHEPSDFSGRTEELIELAKDRLSDAPPALVISAISGMGGVGKTALALKYAHSVIDEYPDGQFYVDLRGYTVGLEPLSPADALAALLRQCGFPEERIPLTLEARAASWRAASARKRALILLDNAGGESQLRPLIPGARGPLVLITTRRRMSTVEGCAVLPLDVMPLADACALFTRIVGTNRLDVDDGPKIVQIVEHCGQLPLAIRIAAARFRDRRTWDLDHLLRLLADRDQRHLLLDQAENGISAVLQVSYDHIVDERQRRVFRLLGICPQLELAAPVAAVLADIPLREAQQTLDSLVDDNLLQEAKPGVYRFHDLVRECAARLCESHDSEALRTAAAERLLDYYLECAISWCRPLARAAFQSTHVDRPSGLVARCDTPADSIRLLTESGDALIEAAKWALSTNHSRQGWRLAVALQPLLRRMCYGGPSLAIFTDAIAAARLDRDRRGEVLCLLGAALANRDNRRATAALDLLEEALSVARHGNDTTLEAYALIEMGGVMFSAGSYREAASHYELALAISGELNDPVTVAALKNNLGTIHAKLGQDAEALRYLQEALAEYEAADDIPARSYAHLNLAELQTQQGDHLSAIHHLEAATHDAYSGNLNQVTAAAAAVLAVSYRAIGELPKSFTAGRRALKMSRTYNVVDIECYALNALGEAHVAAGDLPAAEESFHNALQKSADAGLRGDEGRACEGLAHIALRRGEVTLAGELFHKALRIHADSVDSRYPTEHLDDDLDDVTTCLRCVSHSRPAPSPMDHSNADESCSTSASIHTMARTNR